MGVEQFFQTIAEAGADAVLVVDLPFEEQKKLRKGNTTSNKIFKKGRSEKLKFKK